MDEKCLNDVYFIVDGFPTSVDILSNEGFSYGDYYHTRTELFEINYNTYKNIFDMGAYQQICKVKQSDPILGDSYYVANQI